MEKTFRSIRSSAPASAIIATILLIALTASVWSPSTATAQESLQAETALGAPSDGGVPIVEDVADPDDVPFDDLGPDVADEPVDVIDRWRAAPDTIFDASEIVLGDLRYVARPLIVLATSPNDPMVAEQIGLFTERMSELVARDVIIIVDTDPSANTEVRAQFRPRGFSMILVTKDGRIALRKPVPWAVREIVHTIDRLPIRQQELREN